MNVSIHSPGHVTFMLHGCVCTVPFAATHAAPPFAAGVLTLNVCD
jgi:hypothetical protein